MTTVVQHSTRTTRSGTRVVTASTSASSLRSSAKTPVQKDARARTPILRDTRTPVRNDARTPIPWDPRARTPVLRETRSRRDLAATTATAAAASLPSPAPPLPAVPTAHAVRERTPSPEPPLLGMLEGPSPLALFVTNIKLLNLDRLPDWPRITVQTFVPPGPGTQGQKRRIHCAEWVLFQLFSIWDPEETENKLKPFYPPVDQNQSAELRAALTKSLERAKKMGALGRDAIIRKSTLEECKADRLEDILAYFSTAVLRRVVRQRLATTGQRIDPVLASAIQNLGPKADKADLAALTLAYRASLKRLLGQKKVTRACFRDLADVLDEEEQGTARRNEALLAKEIRGIGQSVSDNARAEMRRTLRNNWSGNDAWMDALLGGDAKETGLLSMPFDEVWSGAQKGRLAELETEGSGLLQQLETRVQVQKERLQKWNAFRRDMFGSSVLEVSSPSKAKVFVAKSKGLDLGFEEHMNLQIGRVNRLSFKVRVHEPSMSEEYAGIVSGLQEDLARISKKDVDPVKLFAQRLPKKAERHQRRAPSMSSVDGDGESEISDLEDAESVFRSEVSALSFQDRMMGSSGPSLRPRLSRPELNCISVEGSSGPAIPIGQRNFPGKSRYDIDQLDLLDPITPPPRPKEVKVREVKPVTPPSKGRKPRRLDLGSRPGAFMQDQLVSSPTQYLADDDSPHAGPMMKKHSPSPLKRTKPRHTLSVTERAQLSLTRKSSFFLEDEAPDLVHEPASMCSSTAEHTAEELDSRASSSETTADDLVSRTRRSMAGYEKAQQKAQLERRRSQRRPKSARETSYYPRVKEDSMSLVDQLADEEDPEAVFRSRPKIAQTSPMQEWAYTEYGGYAMT